MKPIKHDRFITLCMHRSHFTKGMIITTGFHEFLVLDVTEDNNGMFLTTVYSGKFDSRLKFIG